MKGSKSKGDSTGQAMLGGFEELVDLSSRDKLRGKFLLPPFSVLDTRQGYWQARKHQWLELGIQSEIGRGENLLKFSSAVQLREKREESLLFKSLSGRSPRYYTQKAKVEAQIGHKLSNTEFEDNYLQVNGRYATGTSVFDPVLCELMYKWFCPDGGAVLDPFAGGSVRGIVASMLGYDYVGIDLAGEQLEANREQAREISPDCTPTWIQGDSREMNELLPAEPKYYDFVFSCPPFHNLEKYGDDMDDLSNMSWEMFKVAYAEIITKSILRLNTWRFACFVVSEIRETRNGVEEGYYKGLVPWTIEAFRRAGAAFYNEIILVNAVGSLALRIGTQFGRFRKVGRTHQNVLVFFKGDPEQIPRFFKEVDTELPNGKVWAGNSEEEAGNPPDDGPQCPTASLHSG